MRGTGCSGRRLRLLRAAAEPRRLRRRRDHRPAAVGPAPQGRDDGHLLRRHQPAVHRPDPAAEPGRDRAASRSSTPRRRRCIRAASSTPGSPSPGRRSASTTPSPRRPPAASPGPTSGSSRATRPARPTRCSTPRRWTSWPRSARTTTTCRPLPIRCRRSRSSTRSTCRCSWPASGPTSRPAATAPTWPSTSPGRHRKWFTFTNGTHVDSLAPETFNRWYDFLELYVAQQAPIVNSARHPRGRARDLPGGDGDHRGDAAARPDPAPADLRRRRWRRSSSLPPVRVLFDNGAGGAAARPPGPGLRALVAELPDPGHHGPLLVPGAGRRARRRPAGAAGADAFTWNAHARPLTDFTGDTAAGAGGLWTATPPYQWTQSPAGSAASYVTSPLSANTTVVGAGAVHAWVRSSTPNVDLQATITRGQARRQGDLRAGRLAARRTSASSTPPRARRSSRSSASGRPTSRRCRRTGSSR